MRTPSTGLTMHTCVAIVAGALVVPQGVAIVQRTADAAAVATATSQASTFLGGRAATDRRISPALRPVSDDKFFRKDYPHDGNPKNAEEISFGHPYPIIQDSGDYDKDFVKDENADKGEWKAQESYDHLRVKIKQLEKEADLAKVDELKWKEALQKAEKAEADAERKSKEAELAAEEAKLKAKKAQEEVDELIGKEGGKQMGGKIGEQVGEVNKEINDLSGCQKALKNAQDRLKKLEKERAARQKELDEALRKAGVTKDEAEAKYNSAKQAEYEKMDEELKRKLREEQDIYAKAVKEYSMSEEEVKKTEEELDTFAQKLRDLRSKADPQGGVYVAKSNALAAATPSWSLAALMTLACAALSGVALP